MELKASLGRSLKAAGCSGCGEVFTTVGNFDSHQRWVDRQLTCLPPESVGLVRYAHGRWGMPSKLPVPDSTVGPETDPETVRVQSRAA